MHDLAVIAASQTPEFLSQVVAVLVGGAVVAYVTFRFGVVPIVGFLLAGVLIGPSGLGLVEDREMVDAAAEIGVILLLFTIGLEFSLERLSKLARTIFIGGATQVVLTTAATTGILVLAGVDTKPALFTGLLVSLSSTVIVLKLLGDRAEMHQPHGESSLGLLLFQDLAIVLMVLLVPVLGTEGSAGGSGELLEALGKAVGIVGLTIFAARRLMPPVLERVARTCSPEVFLLTIVAICFGTAYATSLAGVSVSLGAFLGGLIVSESRFDQQALGEVLPLQIIFSATFFVSIGMLLDTGFLLDNLPVVLGVAVAVLTLKALAAAISIRALGFSTAAALSTGLLLAQIGEFSFVLNEVGRDSGLSPAGLGDDGSQAFIATTVLLMVATPGLMTLGHKLRDRLPDETDEPLIEPGTEPEPGVSVADALHNHVIVAGFGATARRITEALRRAGVPHVIATLSPDGAAEAHAAGSPVLLGDSARQVTLQQAGIARASRLLILDHEPQAAMRVAQVASNSNPDLKVIGRTRYLEDAALIEAAGAHYVIAEEGEADAHMAEKLLYLYDVPGDQIDAQVAMSRRLAVPATPPVAATGNGSGPARSRGGLTVVDTEHAVEPNIDPDTCPHTGQAKTVVPRTPGCEECLRDGTGWVHLRLCMTCGHVGCCDSSPNRHARRHHEETGHHVIRSAEPGDDWSYCLEDERMLPPARAPAR